MTEDIHVYIIAQKDGDQWASPCKIGIARDVRRRLAQFQTSSPFKLGCYRLFTFPTRQQALEIERLFHHMQRDVRLHGEWFNLEPHRTEGLMELYIEMTLQMLLPDFTPEENKATRRLIFGGGNVSSVV